MRRQHLFPGIALLALIACTAYAGPYAPHVTPETSREIIQGVREAFRPPALLIGDRAPAFEPRAWARGEPIGTFAPGHVYVLDFWASWCAPCIAAMPHISRLQEQHTDDAVMIAVNVREVEPGSGRMLDAAAPEDVAVSLEKMGDKLRLPVAIGDRALDAAWIGDAGRSTLPTYAVIDQETRLAWIGGDAEGVGEVVERLVAGAYDTDAARREQLGAARVQHLGRTINEAAVNGNAEGDLSRFYELCAALSYAAEAGEARYLASIMDTVLTHPLLDGRRDLATAQRGSLLACELTAWRDPEAIRVHALATHMGDDTPSAIRLCERALDAADADDVDTRARITADLERYRTGG